MLELKKELAKRYFELDTAIAKLTDCEPMTYTKEDFAEQIANDSFYTMNSLEGAIAHLEAHYIELTGKTFEAA